LTKSKSEERAVPLAYMPDDENFSDVSHDIPTVESIIEPVSKTGMTRVYLANLAYISHATRRISIYRPVNPASEVAMEEINAKGKRMTTKGKSSIFLMLEGLIPFEPLLSKMFKERDSKNGAEINYVREIIMTSTKSSDVEVKRIQDDESTSLEKSLELLNSEPRHTTSLLFLNIDKNNAVSRQIDSPDQKFVVQYLTKGEGELKEVLSQDNGEGEGEPIFVIKKEWNGKTELVNVSGIDFNDKNFQLTDEYIRQNLIEQGDYQLEDVQLISYRNFEIKDGKIVDTAKSPVTADYDELTSAAIQIFPLEEKMFGRDGLSEELAFSVKGGLIGLEGDDKTTVKIERLNHKLARISAEIATVEAEITNIKNKPSKDEFDQEVLSIELSLKAKRLQELQEQQSKIEKITCPSPQNRRHFSGDFLGD
jgi:hypothetical protein